MTLRQLIFSMTLFALGYVATISAVIIPILQHTPTGSLPWVLGASPFAIWVLSVAYFKANQKIGAQIDHAKLKSIDAIEICRIELRLRKNLNNRLKLRQQILNLI